METYLLNYNPKKSKWNDIDKEINELHDTCSCISSWSCGNRKNIEVGDRIFIIKLGSEERGIIASGWVHNGWYQDISWDEEKAKAGKLSNYIDVDFDIILNPQKNIFEYDELQNGILKRMKWSNQSSGVIIPEDVAIKLEEKWSDYNKKIRKRNRRVDLIAEEVVNTNYYEGATSKILVNKFERNSEARRICIKHYSCKCYACGLNLEDVYGERAKDFIHIHHIVPLYKIGQEYKLNPIKDLRPLCPNCHAVLHRYKPELSINELKRIIRNHKNEP